MYLFDEVSYLNEFISIILLILGAAAYLTPIISTGEYPYWKQYLISLGCILFGIGFLLLLISVVCLFAYLFLGKH